MNVAERKECVAAWLCAKTKAHGVEVTELVRLDGGTVHQNWRLLVDIMGGAMEGKHAFVLRTAEGVGTADSLPIEREFDVLGAVGAAGVPVPATHHLCNDDTVIGQTFLLMEFIEGEARPWKLQRDPAVLQGNKSLLRDVGAALAAIQTITPGSSKLDLASISASPAQDRIVRMRTWLDEAQRAEPAIEFALRWLECHAPETTRTVLVHGDFRVGNLLVANCRLAAIIDWELARWGDPLEDYAWFCLQFFRFGRPDLDGGGLGPRANLRTAYEHAAGVHVDLEAERYWDVMANALWAVISVQQAIRFTSGNVPSLELGLTGLATSEMAYEALRLIDRPERK